MVKHLKAWVILAGCRAIAQTQYLARHNKALKILFFEMLGSLELISTTALWYSQAQPKPMYENDRVVAYWDIPLFADTTHVMANRTDARIIDKERKEVKSHEMSCPWVENREEKAMEKTSKYGPLRWELQQRHPDFKVTQDSITIDVLGGYSQDLTKALKQLVENSYRSVAAQMQKLFVTSSLHIARSFKVLAH